MISLLLAGLLAQVADPSVGYCSGPEGEAYPCRSLARVDHSFCGRLKASDKAGAWWCINGDGTQPAGSVALTPTGDVQNSGENQCGQRSNYLNGLRDYSTASVAQPGSGSLTVCAVFKPDVLGGYGLWIGHGGLNGEGAFGCYSAVATDEWRCFVHSSADTFSSSAPYVLHSGVLVSMCGSYSDADGIPRAFIDGAALTPGAPISPTSLYVSSTPWHAGGLAPYHVSGTFLGAFMTEKQLSPSRIAAISTVCQ